MRDGYWRSLFLGVVVVSTFVTSLSILHWDAYAVSTEKPGDFTALNVNRHLGQILKELPVYDPKSKKFTPERPPSNALRQAVKDIQPAWKKLYDASDFHDIIPPNRIKILKRCDDLKKYLTGPITTKYQMELELHKLKQRERFVDSARKQVTLRNWFGAVGAMGNLAKEVAMAFKEVIAPSPTSVVKKFREIMKKAFSNARKSMMKKPGQTAVKSSGAKNLGKDGLKYFLEHENKLLKLVEKYVRNRNFQPHELRNHKLITSELHRVIRRFLKQQAKKELTGIRKRISKIEIELKKYTAISLVPGTFRFTDYEPLCRNIRALRDWKPRRVVALRIDPPKVRIKVGETAKFKAIAKYSGGTEFYFTNKVNWPAGNSFTGTKPGKFKIDAEYRSLTATADITVTNATAITKGPATPCPPGKVRVPYVIHKMEAGALDALKRIHLGGKIKSKTYTPYYNAGEIMDQKPYVGDCVDPDTEVEMVASLGPKPYETLVTAFSAELECGSSIELAPGDFLGKSCDIVVKGWKISKGRVYVKITYDKSSGIEISPGEWDAPMYFPNPNDWYTFFEQIRAEKTAPAGTTAITITVSQSGAGTVTLPLTVAVLPPGIPPSAGSGIRPPAVVAPGSGGEYCVWRYKMVIDGPNCFNILTAKCDKYPYSSKPEYELVGSGMTWGEASVRASQLSPYKGDAYGCHKQPATGTPTGTGGQEPLACGLNEVSDGRENCICRPAFDRVGGICRPICGTNETRDSTGSCGCSGGYERINGLCVVECAAGEERVNGQCVVGCGTNEERNASGICVCQQGYEPSSGSCQVACGPNEQRNDQGNCTCLAGYDLVGSQCLPQCEVGKKRAADGNCVVEAGADGSCVSNTDCPSGYICIAGFCDPGMGSNPTPAQIAQADQTGEQTRNTPPQGAGGQPGQPIPDAEGEETLPNGGERGSGEQQPPYGPGYRPPHDDFGDQFTDPDHLLPPPYQPDAGSQSGTGGTRPPGTQAPGKPPGTRTVACSTTTKSGQDTPETISVNVGNAAGTAKFWYNMHNIKDRMIVQYGGQTLLDTGCVSGSKTSSLSLPGGDNKVTVVVKPACEETGTQWDFRLECPKAPATRGVPGAVGKCGNGILNNGSCKGGLGVMGSGGMITDPERLRRIRRASKIRKKE